MKIIDRERFFDRVRTVYGGSLTQAQVNLMDAALTGWEQAFTDYGEDASLILPECWVEGPELQILSEQGAQTLVDREGLRTTAYYDSVGVLTIGVGHTSAAGPPTVYEGLTITEDEAMEIFARDNDTFEAVVRDTITRPMAQHQFDAFVSIAYNIGGGGFSGSTFAKRFNAGESSQRVVEAILMWDQPPEIIPRRQAEALCFRDAVYVQTVDPLPPPKAA